MPLREKIFISLLVVISLLLALQLTVSRLYVYPSFIKLEHREALHALERTWRAIELDLLTVDTICQDWASGHGELDEITTADPSSQPEVLQDLLQNASLNLIQYFDPTGITVKRITAPENLAEILLISGPKPAAPTTVKTPPEPPYVSFQASAKGLLMVDGRPFLLASRPITNNNHNGLAGGTLLVGRFLDSSTIAGQSQLNFDLIPATPRALAQSNKDGNQLSVDPAPVISESPEQLTVTRDLADFYGNLSLTLRIAFPRDISEQGRTTMGYSLVFSTLGGLIILLALMLLLNRTVLAPLRDLTLHARSVEETGIMGVRLNLNRRDEIGDLGRSIDLMLDQLKFQTDKLSLMNDELQYLSRIDALTQIGNRREFDVTIDREWKRLAREQAPLTLIMCDVDYFKKFNDTHGHQAGDNCLRAIADVLKTTAKRPADLAARYGGEEFAILLPTTDLAGAMIVAEMIRAGVRQMNIDGYSQTNSITVTVSLGVATMIPQPGHDQTELIRLADAALYQAKNQGRDRVVAAPQEPPDGPDHPSKVSSG
ncbi:MAG: diguanylate cyclase [Proteobacteria bacterium]|nr:diguanylate cyclase [Pseudomonadota bacterium]MBU1687986.1 diguanylate cyclase [Pseudomonadota bacterium]